MGCFSYMCKITGEPVLSSSFNGDAVHMFLLKDGKVIEHMYGNYDSYGGVFRNDFNDDEESRYVWKTPWREICDSMFSEDERSGIAVILDGYWKEGDPYPTTQSDHDPDQGCGQHFKLSEEECENLQKPVEKPYHKWEI